MDTELLIHLNNLARHGTALGDLIRDYAEVAGFVLLLGCLVVLALGSRQGGIGRASRPGRYGLLAAVASGPLAYGLARIAEPIVGRSAPTASGVRLVVLFADGSHTMPDPLTAAAFGVASALALLGGRRVAAVGLFLALVEALAVVAGGAARPSDVAGGAGLGLVVAGALVGLRALSAGREARTTPAGAHHLVAGVQHGQNAVEGPAAHRLAG